MQESILLCFDIVIVRNFTFIPKNFNENNFLIKIEEVQNFDYCNTPLSILRLGAPLAMLLVTIALFRVFLQTCK